MGITERVKDLCKFIVKSSFRWSNPFDEISFPYSFPQFSFLTEFLRMFSDFQYTAVSLLLFNYGKIK